MPKTQISQAGLAKLKAELYELENVKRWEVAERIKSAKELGDLSENVEYSDAKDEQAFLEGRILELKEKIKNAVVVKNNGDGHINMGSKITAITGGKSMNFEIVSANELDPASGKISPESPLGKAFMNKRAGDTAEVETPVGKVTYKIESVS